MDESGRLSVYTCGGWEARLGLPVLARSGSPNSGAAWVSRVSGGRLLCIGSAAWHGPAGGAGGAEAGLIESRESRNES